MKILQIHNKYQQRGGEDVVVEQEKQLLEENGHEVIQLIKENSNFHNLNLLRKFEIFFFSFWSPRSFFELKSIIKRERPDFIHVHNTLPQLTPSIYWAARSSKVKVIQSIHNYRMLSPCGILFKEGKVCEKCNGKILPWASLKFKCYRNSFFQSIVIFLNRIIDRLTQVYYKKIDTYIVLTEFAKKKITSIGIDPSKIIVKSNFTNIEPELGDHNGKYALYVGRVSIEKGITTLLEAWKKIGNDLPLKIVGTGPLLEDLKAKNIGGIDFLGWCDSSKTRQLMKDAELLIFPSLWYEGFPMVLVEALNTGLPIITSNIGSHNEIIKEGINGWKFEVGNADDLVKVIQNRNEDSQLYLKTFESGKKYSKSKNMKIFNRIFNSAK